MNDRPRTPPNLAAAFSALPIGLALFDAGGKLRFWNEEAARMTGYPAAEVEGWPCTAIFGPAIGVALETILTGTQQGIQDQQIRIEQADGTPLRISFSLNPVPEEEQAVLLFRSVSHLLGYQNKLARQQRYLSQVLELAPYGIITVDDDNVIKTFNRAAEQLTGRSATEALGRPFDDVIQTAEPEQMNPQLPATAASESQRAYLQLDDGETIPVRYSIAPLSLPHDTGEGHIVLFDEISDIIAAERVKDEFVSMVSHELRTPLTSIKGFVTAVLAEKVGPINERQRHFLAVSQEESEHLLALINDLLDLSRLDAAEFELERERIALPELLRQSIDVVQPLADKKGVNLETQIAPRLPRLWADRDRLRQLLQNLLSNAVKFTPANGRVTLGVRYNEETDDFLLTVDDTGIGIPRKEQNRIFDSFYQVESVHTRQAGGTGLGLVIVRQIVDAHGGEIVVESEVDVGTTFRVRLPRVGEQEMVVRERSEKIVRQVEELQEQRPLRDAARVAPLILVVDDDPAINELIRFYLKQEGYDVISAQNGKEALALARAEQPDLVTLDILLPEMNGFHVLKALKEEEETADIPVCIISILEDKAKGYRLGSIDYLTKPFESDDLVEAVSEALAPPETATTQKILLIEDDLHTVELIELALEATPYQVLTAHNGVSGLQQIYRHHPDLVILDIMIPKINGYEVIRRVKQNTDTAAIPILVLSVRELDEDIDRALRMGADKYMAKREVAEERLPQIVEEVLENAK